MRRLLYVQLIGLRVLFPRSMDLLYPRNEAGVGLDRLYGDERRVRPDRHARPIERGNRTRNPISCTYNKRRIVWR